MDDLAQLIAETRRVAAYSFDQAADRDDLVQETLLRVWQRLAERGESGVPRGLIRTIITRVRIDWWRKRRRLELAEVDVELQTTLQPLDEVAFAELSSRLRRCIRELPELQREVVRLRYDEHKTFKQVAAIQEAPLNTVLGRMHLAMKRLRTMMEEPGEH